MLWELQKVLQYMSYMSGSIYVYQYMCIYVYIYIYKTYLPSDHLTSVNSNSVSTLPTRKKQYLQQKESNRFISIQGAQHIRLDDTFILLVSLIPCLSSACHSKLWNLLTNCKNMKFELWCLASTIGFQELWSSSSKHLSIAGWWYTACLWNSVIGLQQTAVSQRTDI